MHQEPCNLFTGGVSAPKDIKRKHHHEKNGTDRQNPWKPIQYPDYHGLYG